MTALVATILAASYLGLFLVVFAETGLLLGFFLPGDSLLITAGLLAAQGSLALPLVVLACTAGAVLGDSAGYWIGSRFGERVWSRPGSRWLKPEFVERTHAYFRRYGAKTLVVARFVPVVRTFAPTLAGVGRMPYGTFLTYNVLGGVLWGVGVPLTGALLGKLVPRLDQYILLLVTAVVLVSLVPVTLELLKARDNSVDGR